MPKVCFCGISGSGMSSLAQILKLSGYEVCGTDRSFDLGRDLATKEANTLDNPESGVHELPLSKGAKYQFVITAKAAKGKYKIQKKTIVE